MPAQTISSIGTKLYWDSIAAANEIGNVGDIQGPGFSRDVIDVTTHSSPGDYKEKIVTRWDAGNLTFDLNFDMQDPQHKKFTNELKNGQAADDPKTLVLRAPSDKAQAAFYSVTMSAFLISFELGEPVEGVIKASLVIAITGKPTIVENDTTVP